ncbi:MULTISPECIES: tRNA dihydrouridine synthase DusB [Chryseobacterium]|jgi:tRNA-dihydrouridine synthase B|uniref:tRNA-dihydrouridine synthase n=1 Tax=Chryseobacterium scophthalmum TaxID=59733 RepID=A0A1N6IIP2_9FLAO|nr:MULTISPECIES: tRNA dihydrouridine synthase DusB [Chryseobacterium]MBM7421609.1 nifR3 family TIM-barrel protein [Chryseobacterium sp. JUb44]MBW3524745.1 tRNA dihydrouridine synthase DusB [Chryseobacterium sp. NKUCC03_KSP]MCD0480024.1 tRNA dihydrouridine synthase DusB [Chryseobacterium sp. LC2016-29]MDH6211578.1 tRNA-dihydrouridine synthase B [Chryseobacterium sp. BIGb0186]WSO10220.1 tRNA dihydrouridine synthase DusB [Chryseobacterium scophthalmum]
MIKIGNIELPEFPLLLAPMEDVSDPPYRRLCKLHGADLMYSEFISSEGLIRDAMKSRKKLDIFDYERPVGIQIFGGDEEAMAMSARIVETVNPDLVDINFGCPVKKVVCKGAGAGVLKDVDMMVRLTKAVVSSTSLPVTVKTRLGWDSNSINIDEVAERLQETGIKALTIHARTRGQMYKGEADWEHISRIKQNPNIEIPIFGNGDIDSPEKALEYKNKYACDGIMIGRAAIGYPWIFNEIKHFFKTGENLAAPTISDRLLAVRQHAEWSAEWKGEKLGLIEMRQHYSNYFRGIPHFKDFRRKFLEVYTLEEMDAVIHETQEFYEEYQAQQA